MSAVWEGEGVSRRQQFQDRLVEAQSEFQDVPDTQRAFDTLLTGLSLVHSATGGCSEASWLGMCRMVYAKLAAANRVGAS